jgi:hypothetical protein
LWGHETDADDAALPVGDRVAHGQRCLLSAETTHDLRRQAYLNTKPLACLLSTVAIAAEDVFPARTSPCGLGGREAPLDVDGAASRGFGRVLNYDLAKILAGSEDLRGQVPDLEEVSKVAVAVEFAQLVDAPSRQAHIIAPGDRQQRLWPNRPLEMNMQLDLRVRQRQPFEPPAKETAYDPTKHLRTPPRLHPHDSLRLSGGAPRLRRFAQRSVLSR